MSIVNFTSGINNIEQQKPLSEWAAEFIYLNTLSRENFAATDVFRNLSRRQKDAIRYQLRKGQSVPKQTKVASSIRPRDRIETPEPQKINLLKVAKFILSTWISTFLLFDIVEIYTTKGASSLMAWQAALLVEVCIFVAALTPQYAFRRISYMLFAYNVLIFAIMEVDQSIVKTANDHSERIQIAQKKEQIAFIKKQLNTQLDATSDSIRQLSSAHARGFVTSGSIAFERVSRTLDGSNLKLTNEISRLENDIKALSSNSHTQVWIWITSLLYFILRCILQFFAIKLLEARGD